MSGTGGGGGGGGPEIPQDACEKLFIDTQLSSPKEDVIEQINVGDILEVTLNQINGRSVVVVLYNGQIAGGLASPKVQRLRECIEQHTEYFATVKEKRDGQVRVRIEPRRL